MIKHLLHRQSRVLLAFIATVVVAVSCVYAFTSAQVEAVTAIAVVGGEAPSSSLKILHTPLSNVSEITREAIIQGEAGTNPKPGANFPSRMKPFDVGDPDIIRVTLHYRVQNPDETWSPVVTPPSVEGFDPVAFAFQIDPADIATGNIQYQLIAERLRGDAAVAVGTVTYPPNALTDPDAWVTVGVVSQAAQVFSEAGGRLVIPDGNPNDGESYVDVPANLFLLPVQISFAEVPLNSPFAPLAVSVGNPLALYQFESQQPFSGTLKMSFLYPDFEYPNGQDGILDGTTFPESAASVVWWDGASWRRLNGIRNTTLNTISVRITSDMKLFAIVPAAALSPQDGRPQEKVITPNGDTRNDHLTFNFFDQVSNIHIEIFDVSGRRIRTISATNTTTWDGRDDSGDIVESGVYIYQYTDGGTRISGVVAVAK